MGLMTAAQLVEPGRFDLVRVARPDPGPGQVRVAVQGCGVCASNLPAWQGRPWFQYPLPPGELGHEAWGAVEAVGEGVDGSWVGRRVAMQSSRAYAEYDLAGERQLVCLPEALQMAPLEPFGCIFNVFDRSGIQAEHWTAVVGLGFIGLGVARLAHQAGARVIALSSSPASLEAARAMGIAHCIQTDSDRSATARQVEELTGGRGCARVVECTGYQGPLDLAGDLVAEGGRLIIAGFHQDGPRQIDLQSWNWKGIDVINAHERDPVRVQRGMQAAAHALASEEAWTRMFLTHQFSLQDIDRALQCADERPAGFVKGVVLPAGRASRHSASSEASGGLS